MHRMGISPAAMTAEADLCRNLARGMLDEATRLQDPRERNRKLGAAVELLDKASRLYAEARAVNQIGHRNIIDIFSFGQWGVELGKVVATDIGRALAARKADGGFDASTRALLQRCLAGRD